MQAIILLLLKKIGTEALLFLLKELVKILESRPDNNIDEVDVKAVVTRVSDAMEETAKTKLTSAIKRNR